MAEPDHTADIALDDEIRLLNERLLTLRRELSEARAELAQRDQASSRVDREKAERLLGLTAHDLLNHLNVIHGYAEFLFERGQQASAQDRQTFLEVILGTSHFMAGLIHDLVAYARVTAGDAALRRQPVDLVALARRSIKANQVLAATKGISLHLQPAQPGPISADAGMMERLLQSLVGNAIRLSPPGGELTVSLAAAGDRVAVMVAGTGLDLEEGELARLLDPLAAGLPDEKKHGLGLLPVRAIAEAHGGDVRVERNGTGVSSPGVSSPGVSSPGVSSPGVSSPGVTLRVSLPRGDVGAMDEEMP